MGDDNLLIFDTDIATKIDLKIIIDWYAQHNFVVNPMKNYITTATNKSG